MTFTGREDNNGDFTRRRTAGRYAIFALFTAVGVLALACAALLPEYAVLADLRAERDALDHQLRCDEKLAAYNGRMIHATRDDPVLIARLMIRHGNYRPIGCETIGVDSVPPALSVPQRLLREARNPPQRKEPRLMVRAGLWLSDTTTGGCMILLSLAMIVIGTTVGRAGSDTKCPYGKRRPTFTSSQEKVGLSAQPTDS